MSLKDTQPFIARRGHILLGDETAVEPTQTELATYVADATPITGWTDFGHTNREGFLNDGTDATTEVRGSYQNPSLMVVTTEEATEFVTTDSLQVTDGDVLRAFYGGGTEEDGRFVVPPASGAAIERKLLLIRTNGTKVIGEYFPKVAIQRNGQINWQTEDFALVPLRFTALVETGQPQKVIVSADFTTPVGG